MQAPVLGKGAFLVFGTQQRSAQLRTTRVNTCHVGICLINLPLAGLAWSLIVSVLAVTEHVPVQHLLL